MPGCEHRRGGARDGRGGPGGDRGFVTAEAAMVLPVLVLVVTTLVWGLLVVLAQIQCVDAARVGARAAARQDPDGAVVLVTRRTAPRGAKVTVSRRAGQVRVVVSASPPGLGLLPFRLREEAVAEAEEAAVTDERPGAAGPSGAAVRAGQETGS
ncbi:TadE family type IV pilus minor pilin [Streptomyces sp. NPDC003703]|uniref:TadE family type IV pilus minor pilin n=1 Tax=Streptomyces sp. NPDC003283 TaxID=3364681 RepID=UPI0036C4C885